VLWRAKLLALPEHAKQQPAFAAPADAVSLPNQPPQLKVDGFQEVAVAQDWLDRMVIEDPAALAR
jgi:hypothetical protein